MLPQQLITTVSCASVCARASAKEARHEDKSNRKHICSPKLFGSFCPHVSKIDKIMIHLPRTLYLFCVPCTEPRARDSCVARTAGYASLGAAILLISLSALALLPLGITAGRFKPAAVPHAELPWRCMCDKAECLPVARLHSFCTPGSSWILELVFLFLFYYFFLSFYLLIEQNR